MSTKAWNEELFQALRDKLWYFNHNWQQQDVPLPCGVMEIAQSLPGVLLNNYGCDGSAGRDQLKGVLQIQATDFAVLLPF